MAKLSGEIRMLKGMDGADGLLQAKQRRHDELVAARRAAKPIGAQRQTLVYAINDAERAIKKHKLDVENLEKKASQISDQIA